MIKNLNTINSIINNIDESHIDEQWNIIETKTSFRASNIFTSIRDSSFRYDFIAPFTIIFPKSKPLKLFTLQFNGKDAQYWDRKTGMRDYLMLTIYDAIENYKPQKIEYPQTGDGW